MMFRLSLVVITLSDTLLAEIRFYRKSLSLVLHTCFICLFAARLRNKQLSWSRKSHSYLIN